MFLQIVFVSLAMLALGVALCAAGFRLFVILLPVFGFFAGFSMTAQSIQQLFGGGFLSTVSSWVFGLFIGLIFAVAAYFFYYAAVAILAGTVGYEIGVGILAGLGVTLGFLQFIVGLVLAIAFAAVVIVLNLPKVLIVALTALAGASLIVSSILVALGQIPLTALRWGVLGDFIRVSWFWSLICLLVAAAGFTFQILLPSAYNLTPYSETELYKPVNMNEAYVSSEMTPGTGQGEVPAV